MTAPVWGSLPASSRRDDAIYSLGDDILAYVAPLTRMFAAAPPGVPAGGLSLLSPSHLIVLVAQPAAGRANVAIRGIDDADSEDAARELVESVYEGWQPQGADE